MKAKGRDLPFLPLLGLGLGLLVLSCASQAEAYQEADQGVGTGSYGAALGVIEKRYKSKKSPYQPKNAVLYCLDKGIIEHYAGDYAASSASLEQGERLIELNYTKSITQEAASYIISDNTRDYGGEDYEDIYINVFNALNYYHRGDLEGAMVEIRRSSEKLRYLGDKYAAQNRKVRDYAAQNRAGGLDYRDGLVRLDNSALARYLGALFYRGGGLMDDARIDLEELRRVYAEAPQVYPQSPPRSLEEELVLPPGKARLNLIGFAGLSPVKEEEIVLIPLPFPFPNNIAKLSLPKMVSRPSRINRIEVVLDTGERFNLELLEDMGLVALETFKAREGLIFAKTLVRLAIKAAAAAAATGIATDQGGELLGIFVGLGAKIAADASEQADIRMSRYFPRYAFAGGINLDPGIYSFRVNYYGPGGLVQSFDMRDVPVKADKLNLVEAICLK
jgi:hypothetical protein